MKQNFTLALLLLITMQGKTQDFNFGPKLNFGTGMINSKNLQKSFDVRNAIDGDIIAWDAKSRLGFHFGIGGFAEYSINDNFSVVGELTYNFLNSKIKIDYKENDVDGSGDGDIKTIESEAKIKLSYLQLPILAKYTFSNDMRLYALGGFGFNFVSTPEISSSETKTKEVYENGILIKTDIELRSVSADLDNFKGTQLSFIVGGGITLDAGGRDLLLDIRYNLPLTKSEMYTTNWVYHDIAYDNNEVFSAWGKSEAELEAPQHRLNNFKMSTITISIAYVLFSK